MEIKCTVEELKKLLKKEEQTECKSVRPKITILIGDKVILKENHN